MTYLRFLVFALFLAPMAAFAQSAPGQWNCEMGFQNTAPGVPANAVGAQFQMAVYPNGFAEGQGTEMASSGQFPFQFQGQWQLTGRQIFIQGTKSGGLGFSTAEFTFQSNFVSQNEMAYTHHYANGQVYASRCFRIG